MENKKKELLLKIKNLINSNNINESKAAERFLNKLLEKYSISLEELESELTEEREIKFKTKYRRLTIQILYSFIEKSKNPKRKILRLRGSKTIFYVNLTNEEYIELMAMLDFYYRAYEDDFDTFYLAFIFKQDLLLNSVSDEPLDSDKIKKYKEAVVMSNFLKNHTFRKQIENK